MPAPYTPVAPVPPAWYGAPSLGLTYGAQNIGRTSQKDGGGQHFTIIPLPVQPVDELTMQARADAISSTYSGLLMQAVDLYRLTVERNGFMSGILDTMAHGFLGLPLSWKGDAEMVAALMDVRDEGGQVLTPGDFSRMHPENECAKIFSDGIGIGLGLGQYLLMCWRCDGIEWERVENPLWHDIVAMPDGSTVAWNDAPKEIETCKRCGAKRHQRPLGQRELYQLRWRDARWLWRNTVTLQWYYTGRQGMIPITPGDGEWFLFCTVPDQDIWIHGPWALGTEAAIFARDSRYDMQAISATCAPTHVFQFQGPADPRTRADVDAQAENIRFQNKLTLPGEVKHEIHAATGGDGGYVGTADRITNWAQAQWEVKVTGIQQGTTTGEGFSNLGVLQRVSRERRAFYAGGWIRQIVAQGLRWWASDNFGGRPCPVGNYDTRSPEDKLAASKADESEGAALKSLAEAWGAVGYELDPAYLEERAQAKGLRVRKRAGAVVLTDEQRGAVVLGSDGRASLGLQPFGDERDGQTLAALQNAGKGGAAAPGKPAGSPAPAAPAGAQPSQAGGGSPPPAPPAASPAPVAARVEVDDDDDDDDDDERRQRAEAMNAYGMTACRHNRTKVCPRCGVRGHWMPREGGGWAVTWHPLTRAPRAA